MDIFVEEKALKPSFCTEKFTPQVFCEDVWFGNGVSGDDLFVDGLLDFSNDDYENVFVQEGEEEIQKEGFSSASEQNSSEEALSAKDEFGSGSLPPTSELSVPMDELANLEWLSHFVEDSFSEFSLQNMLQEKPKLQVPKQQQNHNHHEHWSEPEDDKRSILKTTGFLSSVPVKARSKRSRTGGRVWSMGSLSLTDSSSSSFSSSSSSSSYFIFNGTGGEIGGSARLDFFNHLKKPPKKSKKKPGLSPGSGSGSEGQRRCSHCGVQKTPQWRTGPMGAKTLCNACGVRFKSGRLLPEYRPACSPTFSSEVHSNNHRKVLEMRRKKETTMVVTQHEPAVQSFYRVVVEEPGF